MTTLLLARHILRTVARQRSRTFMVWAALVAALGVVVGLLSFVASINDSFERRGKAVRGVADVQVQAVAQSSLGSGLARRLERVRGTRFAVPVTQQRATLRSRGHSVVATAYGIDRRARRLRSTMQRELSVRVPRRPENGGLSLSADMARRLDVGKGDRIRLFAHRRTPRIRVARVVDVPESLADVITLPRSTLERLRGSPGRPNTIYVKLTDSDLNGWKQRARASLPSNAAITTPAGAQRELDNILDLAVRSYTYMFGTVVLSIVGLLIYVLQLMRMLERQEDAGLVRALGSGWAPLARAEIVVLALALATAVVPGALLGRLLAEYLAGQLPTFLAEGFNFTVQIGVKASVVAAAAALALAVGALATVAALATVRRPVADQLGRAPQAGATVTARIPASAAVAMVAIGSTGFVGCLLLAGRPSYLPYVAAAVLSIATATAGVTALLIRSLGRIGTTEGRTLLVTRSALEAHPRRVAFSAAIVALGLAAVAQMQLVGHGLNQRADTLTSVIKPSSQRVVASDDALSTVPMRQEYVRQVLREPKPKPPEEPAQQQVAPPTAAASATTLAAQRAEERRQRRLAAARLRRRPLPRYTQSVAFTFTSYRERRVQVFGLDARRVKRLMRGDVGLAAGLPTLRRHRRNGVLISKGLAAWSGLGRGDRVRIRTARGPRRLRVVKVVDDVAWSSGALYMDIERYQKLYRSTAISALAVTESGHLRKQKLENLRPLHTVTGRELADSIQSQVGSVVDNILAMRFLTVLAALVAVGGILATSVFARRREWGVLRAMGMGGTGLLWPLALEVLLIMVVGVAAGMLGGALLFEGPVRGFMGGQGIPVEGGVAFGPLVTAAAGAVLVGTLAVMVPSWLVARTRLAEALSYE